jgi:hypothetical protein
LFLLAWGCSILRKFHLGSNLHSIANTKWSPYYLANVYSTEVLTGDTWHPVSIGPCVISLFKLQADRVLLPAEFILCAERNKSNVHTVKALTCSQGKMESRKSPSTSTSNFCFVIDRMNQMWSDVLQPRFARSKLILMYDHHSDFESEIQKTCT